MQTPPVAPPDYQALFDAAPTPYLVVTATLHIAAVNQAYLQATRTVRDEIVGRYLFDVFPDNPGDPAASGVANLQASLRRVLQNGCADTMAVQKYDIPVATPDGVRFEERYWSPVNTPVFDAAGAVSHIIHRVEDVTAYVRESARNASMASTIDAQALEIGLANRRLREANEELERRVAARTDAQRQTEERLRDSELRFRLMADSIPQIVWMVDGAGQGIYFNRQWLAYTGVQPATAAPERISAEFVHPDDHAATMEAWQDAMQTGQGFHVEHRIRSAAGDYRWFLVRAEPYRDPGSGDVSLWFGTSTDVHDRKMAEAALRKSEQRYRSLFDSIDEGFCIIRIVFDEHGQPVDYVFCDTNPSSREQTGLADAVGKSMRELAPDHEAHWFDIYGQVARTGVPLRFENQARALNRWFDVFAFRIEEDDDPKVALLFKDITGQKRMTETLRRSECAAIESARQAEAERQRLDALLQAAPVGIVVSDANGAILLANAAHRHLWGERNPGAAGVEQFGAWKGWWADHSGRHGRPLAPREWTTARILDGEENPRDLVAIESFDVPPVRRTVLITGAPVRDSQGAIVGAVVAQMDISDRIKAEDALRQADRRKDEFLAMLAHELRNPLAPIAAAADLLALGKADEARNRLTSGIIARQVRHMTGLVDDLLDVSRVTRGLVKLDKSRLDAKKVLADAVEQVRPLIEARRHALTVRVPPEPAFVMGDAKRLVQVVSNLLNNAAKYTPEGGAIALGMTVDGGRIEIAVSDSGIGLTPEFQAHAFELFTQAARTSDRSQGGLGIGLALVRSLVELHGGRIAVHSDGIGKGSRFAVQLPRLEEAAPGANAEAHPAAPRGAGRTLKVMVVDDNADAAQMLGVVVEALGHQAIVLHHAHRAIERSRVEQPDIYLLDIGLPDMDGYQLAQRLRSQPETARATLIAVTGYGQEQDRLAALRAGFDQHFAKPIDSARLAAVLAESATAP
ncbi:PAS domain-containing hybrid sensor histidine kinase/response regulator [Pseudoduganella albidiflava]|uniref:histidine kinase n=1 Tax=Pseudoduganella albidiflava TaxID=321983 RepID=A0A411X0P8_9BURK|nr:PAS domain S-box protein [Pseudoduganella albidiflava]QBI02534.1 PAS domain S-box protein [Pseudoduganella albidiflava]GGY42023.1 hypothetical protein GCM10007387_24970 [Pseudoduganella albidiflava]